MRVPLLDLVSQYGAIRAEVDAAIADVVQSQRFVLGETVERFEHAIAEYIGVRHAVGCASGTDAILLSLRALDIEPGAEVIVPAFTFFATAGAVWNAGLKPVFVDIDPVTYNIDPVSVRRAVTSRTRAIIPVHLFGQMADLDAITAIAAEHGLHIVEDAAQAIGARQRVGGEMRGAGTVGATGAFSFFPTKNLGGFGDGGLVTTNDDALADRLRKLRVHGGRQMYHHVMVGYNSRLDALQAAVLSAKLPHLDRWTRLRREHAAFYERRLAHLEPHVRLPRILDRNEHVFNQYTLWVERRDELKRFLDDHGIGNSIYYPVPLHLQECFRSLGHRAGDLLVSEAAAQHVISIPVFPELSEEQREEVVSRIEEFYQ